MIPFLFGLMIGGTLGFIAAAIVTDSARRDDAYLEGLMLRVVDENDSSIWPYRVDSYIDDYGVVVRNFYDDRGKLHHTDKGTI